MRRRGYLTMSGALLASLAGCTGFADPDDGNDSDGNGAGLQNPSFESGTDGWVVGQDLPDDPNKSSGKVDASVTPTTDRASDGNQSLDLFIDGSQDDGTIWVQQTADLSDVQTLAVDIWAEQASFNLITKVAAYTGPEPDDSLVETDFNTERQAEDHGGWKTYEYPVDHDGTGLVAAGITVVWETGVVRGLDNVRLLERPPANASTDGGQS